MTFEKLTKLLEFCGPFGPFDRRLSALIGECLGQFRAARADEIKLAGDRFHVALLGGELISPRSLLLKIQPHLGQFIARVGKLLPSFRQARGGDREPREFGICGVELELQTIAIFQRGGESTPQRFHRRFISNGWGFAGLVFCPVLQLIELAKHAPQKFDNLGKLRIEFAEASPQSGSRRDGNRGGHDLAFEELRRSENGCASFAIETLGQKGQEANRSPAISEIRGQQALPIRLLQERKKGDPGRVAFEFSIGKQLSRRIRSRD